MPLGFEGGNDPFVLQDHLFEPNSSWSLPQHLLMVSEWSAKCSQAGDPMSCINTLQSPQSPPDFGTNAKKANPTIPDYAWTDLTYLLFKNNVRWIRVGLTFGSYVLISY